MILEVKDLSVNFNTYNGVAKVLDEVSLYVDKEESVALIGETGCGKSVTMKTILGILPVPPGEIISGQIIFKGKEILNLEESDMGRLRGSEVALIPQTAMSSLNPLFTVEDHLKDLINLQGKYETGIIDYILMSRRIKTDIKTHEKALEMLKEVALPEPERIFKAYPFELSGGEKQRVVIAMALLGNPSLLIADEPGTALDVTTANVILDLMKKKMEERKVSIIYVTHNLAVARLLAKRIYVMYAGTIVESANTKKIFENPQHPYTQGLMKAVPRLTGDPIEGIEGRVVDYYKPPSGCRFSPRCKYAKTICSKSKPEFVKIGVDHWIACHQTR